VTTQARRRVVAGVLLVAALVWIAVNGPVEGPTLLVLTPGNGLTVADLPSIAAIIVAVWLVLPRAPRRARRVRTRRRRRYQRETLR
jgi:ABC-type uncharacterized transport system permease subunit